MGLLPLAEIWLAVTLGRGFSMTAPTLRNSLLWETRQVPATTLQVFQCQLKSFSFQQILGSAINQYFLCTILCLEYNYCTSFAETLQDHSYLFYRCGENATLRDPEITTAMFLVAPLQPLPRSHMQISDMSRSDSERSSRQE